MKINTTTNYNWKKYNKNNSLLSKKFEKFNNNSIINFDEQSYYNHTRDLLALCLISSKKINVLDFGSNIAVISNLKNKIRLKNVTFYIFDPFNSKGYSKINSLKNIRAYVVNDLSFVKKITFNLIHFGSCIQYLKDYRKPIKNINFSKDSKILITATPLTLNKEYLCKQSNQINLFQIIHNFKKLESYFKKLSFYLIFKSSFNIKLASIKNIKKKTFILNLLFKK